MEQLKHAVPVDPDLATQRFYVDALTVLDRHQIPYVVGGGYAMAYYTGMARTTKDLDIFVRPSDEKRVLSVLADAGYRTEYFYPFWIAKALCGEAFMDILYNSGNGLCPVDDEWFTNACDVEVHGYRTRLCPAEEQLWSKAFVQDRDRFDGADVNHLILARGHTFDWDRLLRRFAGHERVLLAHLILYGYVFPNHRDRVPEQVIQRLLEIMRNEPVPEEKVCQGTMIAQMSYLKHIFECGYADARLHPHGPLTREQLRQLPGMENLA